MTKLPSNRARNVHPIRRALLRCIGGFGACAMLTGCGPADETGAGEPGAVGEPVGQSQEAILVDCATTTPNDTFASVKEVVNLGKDVVKAYYSEKAQDWFTVAKDIFELGGGPSIDEKIANMTSQLLCLAPALDWKMVELDYNDKFAKVSAAWMEAQSVGFARQSYYDGSSHDATVASGGRAMWTRLYVSGDPPTSGPWKSIITNNQPDHPNNQVFDWRMALPGFMRLMAARVAMIKMMDPNFDRNHAWDAELGDGDAFAPGYRGVLKARLQEMIAGVRCEYKDRLKLTGDAISRTASWSYDHTDIACADVNTGINMTTTFVRPDGPNCGSVDRLAQQNLPTLTSCLAGLPSTASSVAPLRDSLRRQVLRQLPIYQVQSAIDALFLYTHPGPDLGTSGRIPLVANGGLCLAITGGNPAPGTPLQIYTCNGAGGQRFSYDRKTETIRNTALNQCLQVRPNTFPFLPAPFNVFDNLLPGAVLETANCASPPTPRQKWAYDPEQGIVRSEHGTVWDVQNGNLQAGTTVAMRDYNGTNAQKWRAELLNLALGHSSWQSTDLPGYGAVAGRANDGNTDGNFWNGSVTHTDYGFNPWGGAEWPGQHWYVDVGAERVVQSLLIYNRTDCCGERLSPYNILAWDSAEYVWKVIANQSNAINFGLFLFVPINNVRTQYVMVAKTDENYLSLAEVQVMGY
jgi:hypothetical protein